MVATLSTLTVDQLDAERRNRKAVADAAFLKVTGGGQIVPGPAARRRVDRLTAQWEAVLDEYARRGLLIEH